MKGVANGFRPATDTTGAGDTTVDEDVGGVIVMLGVIGRADVDAGARVVAGA